MGKLKDFAFRTSEFLKIKDGEPVIVELVKFEVFIDHDNEDREKVRYTFLVDGIEKKLESQSIGLAEQMDGVKPGETVKITRTGAGRNTRYEVEGMVKPKGQTGEVLEKTEKKKKTKNPVKDVPF